MVAGMAERDHQVFGIFPGLDPYASRFDPMILAMMDVQACLGSAASALMAVSLQYGFPNFPPPAVEQGFPVGFFVCLDLEFSHEVLLSGFKV